MSHPIFNEEHEIFRRTLRSFVEQELQPHADEWEKACTFPAREVLLKMGALGFVGITVPEAYGGAGADEIMSAVVVEEMARCQSGGVAAAYGMHSQIILPAIARIGSDGQKEKYLPAGVRGELIGCLGVTEPDAGSDVAAMRTLAVKDGDDYVINGSKMFITNGAIADLCVLAARTDRDKKYEGVTLFLVETDNPGFKVGKKLDKLGWRPSDTAELFFDDMRVPASAVLGGEGAGFIHIMTNFMGERLYMALGSVASAQLTLDATVRYVKERRQFGKSLSKFQVIRHKLADMAIQIEAARQLCYNTLRMVAAEEPCQREIAMCKVFACQTAIDVADQAIQLHGGYGYMTEYLPQRAWRDARLGTIGGGTSEIQKEIITRLMDL